MKVYVSNESLLSAVEYFRDMTYSSPEQIGLFFLFKFAGMNSKVYKQFGDFDAESREHLRGCLYRLSALFNMHNETGKKRTGLFPFSITPMIQTTSYYNGGTDFASLLTRVKDTIDNTLIDDKKYLRKDETKSNFYRFAPNYIELLLDTFLLVNKISLGRFAAWYFRFTEFNVPEDWERNQSEHISDFTRICIKKFISDINITPEERSTLFEEDNFQIEFSSEMIAGDALRQMLSFEDNAEPEVVNNPMTALPSPILSLNEVNDILTPRGNNITAERLTELIFGAKQIILAGPPGTGKTHVSNQIKQQFDDSHLIQFHPNLTYEQFIGGYVFDKEGNVLPKAGVFVEFCEKARYDSRKNYLFLIDEINRGNLSKVFGEVILTLDREYTAHLPTPLLLINGEKIATFAIPDNVYIIATMNSADRSIALVDYAIRRRFAFVNFYPNSEIVDYLSDYTGVEIQVGKLMERMNEKLFSVLGDSDLLLGQSYFMPKWALDDDKIRWTNDILKIMFNYYILPIVEEYTYGNHRHLINVMGDSLINRIDNTEEFVKELVKQFSV